MKADHRSRSRVALPSLLGISIVLASAGLMASKLSADTLTQTVLPPTTTSGVHTIYALSTSTSPTTAALFGNNNGTLSGNGGIGVEGCSFSGIAGYFQITSSLNVNPALSATTVGTGYAVMGANTGSQGGAGSFSISNSSNTSNALVATTAGAGSAINAYNTGNSGRSGSFTNTSTSNTGIALYGQNWGSGVAVEGYAGSTATGYAGLFQVDNTASSTVALQATTVGTGPAVDGYTTSATGVAGQFVIANASSTGYAVVGHTTSSSGYDGYFYGGLGLYATAIKVSGSAEVDGGLTVNGNTTLGSSITTTTILGTLTKPGGSFLIDDPLDKANKYLYHSFVESPDMKNVYDGVVTTDGQGNAVVQMPAYVEALNRDFRYQLTVVGQFSQAIIAQEIQNSQFTISTDKPNVKVCWQVTGIRQDDWANAHRIPNEVDKPAELRGKYLYPAEAGVSPTLAIYPSPPPAPAPPSLPPVPPSPDTTSPGPGTSSPASVTSASAPKAADHRPASSGEARSGAVR